MKKIFLILSCLQAISLLAAEPAKFEVRLVEDGSSPDSEELSFVNEAAAAKFKIGEKLYVGKEVLVDSSMVKSATVQTNPLVRKSEVMVILTESGAERFAEATRSNIGSRLAIVVDGKIYAAPLVSGESPGGRIRIVGAFKNEEEAQALADRLNRLVAE